MKKVLLILFALLISMSSICSASVITIHPERWESINTKQGNSTFYIDKTDIRYTKEYILFDLASVTPADKEDDIYKIKYYIDDDTYIVNEMILYMNDQFADAVKSPGKLEKIEQGSVMDMACQAVITMIMNGQGTKI